VDESGGLVKEQTLTATKMAVGTPEYMAPELFKPRSKPDGQADQYALAVTVYEMLSGEKPFKGDRAHIIVEHSALPVPPLSGKVPGLPQSLCMAVERALSKNALERFTTCSKFAAAVVADLAVLPPEADMVRLLCPSCKNILKLPQKAAGKTGKCPRCQTAMDVAADLGSLWLKSEERGGGTALGDEHVPILTDDDVIRFPPLDIAVVRRWRRGLVIVAALFWPVLLFSIVVTKPTSSSLAGSWIEWLVVIPLFGFLLTMVFLHYLVRVICAVFELISPIPEALIEVKLSEVGGGWIRGTCIDDVFAPAFLGKRGIYDSLTVAIQDIDYVKHVKEVPVLGRRKEWTTFKLVCKAEQQRAPVWVAETSAAILRHALKAKGVTILDDGTP